MVLQPGVGPIEGQHYLRSTPETCRWGFLPNRTDAPVLRVASGDTVTVDAVSHEGVLEDQGRDPVAFFGYHGIAAADVLTDAVDIAASGIEHTRRIGPHIVTGPVAVSGAVPGDWIRIDVLGLHIRAPYGVISSRHGYGALPGELPVPARDAMPAALFDSLHPDLRSDYATKPFVSHLISVLERGGRSYGVLPGTAVRFPLAPFFGLMGVARDTDEAVPSVPPGEHGGNIDINELQVGSSLYLRVQVDGGLVYVGDPHYAQGDGEVALTAVEAPLRGTLRLTRIPARDMTTLTGATTAPFCETATHWIPVGLDADLDEAMRQATRAAVAFLGNRFGLSANLALAYLSAAADFEVSQVVDAVKGVHCMIRKSDFDDVAHGVGGS